MRRLTYLILLAAAGCFSGPAPDCRDPALASECQGSLGGVPVSGGGGGGIGGGGPGDGGVGSTGDGGSGLPDGGPEPFDAGFGLPLDGGPPP
jgi:hypothetical protein